MPPERHPAGVVDLVAAPRVPAVGVVLAGSRAIAGVIENLVQAGFPADDIMVVDDAVYVGRDAVVSLAASREMLEAPGSTKAVCS